MSRELHENCEPGPACLAGQGRSWSRWLVRVGFAWATLVVMCISQPLTEGRFYVVFDDQGRPVDHLPAAVAVRLITRLVFDASSASIILAGLIRAARLVKLGCGVAVLLIFVGLACFAAVVGLTPLLLVIWAFGVPSLAWQVAATRPSREQPREVHHAG